jgi:hypothetical protein
MNATTGPVRLVAAVAATLVMLSGAAGAEASPASDEPPPPNSVSAFGAAPLLGPDDGMELNRPVVTAAATPSGDGYWLAASDGGIFSFGDANFHGSTGDIDLNQPIVGMAPTPTGDGYWLAASDGGIFSFGDANFHGSTGNFQHPQALTVDIAARPDGDGYWLVHGPSAAVQEMARFTTPLTPGEDRNHNVHLAADLLDGTVIEPGEELSLNEAIGERTSARGFIGAPWIPPEGGPDEVVGGGVSQLSTTLLNAAWFAGLEIEDFQPHSVYFQRYPMCREGTISWRTIDLVLVNDTPRPVTISTSYSDSDVTVVIEGVDWFEVSSWTGDPYDTGDVGGEFSVDCGRTVTDVLGVTTSESYSWDYEEGYPG